MPLHPLRAELRPERVHVAEAGKNKSYIQDGLIIGGDQAIDDVIIKGVRRAPNPGFERIVIDLEGIKKGEPSAIQRPPYYQVAVSPDERRLTFSIWGRPKLNFDSQKVLSDFKRSSIVESVTLLPRLEDESWTCAFDLKANATVEVFELANPVRIIVDIKQKKK